MEYVTPVRQIEAQCCYRDNSIEIYAGSSVHCERLELAS